MPVSLVLKKLQLCLPQTISNERMPMLVKYDSDSDSGNETSIPALPKLLPSCPFRQQFSQHYIYASFKRLTLE
jgi:hypothetical protein